VPEWKFEMSYQHFLTNHCSFTDVTSEDKRDKFVDKLYHPAAEGNLTMGIEML
jgi:hypothetical protein